MKNLPYFALLVFTCLILVTAHSCKKDDQDNADENTPADTTGQNNPAQDSTHMKLSASVDGTTFAADTSSINYSYDDVLNLHVFTGPDNSGHIVTIMLSTLTAGTYDIDFDNAIVIYQNGTTVYTGANNPQGQIVISKNQNNTISGTFHAELFDFNTAGNVSVTDGHFINLHY